MLRELGHLILPELRCYFCRKPLMHRREESFGHRRHGPVPICFTVHHINEDRDDNRFLITDLIYPPSDSVDNLVLAHPLCHKVHHGKLSAAGVANE
jgi:hypothetical protein